MDEGQELGWAGPIILVGIVAVVGLMGWASGQTSSGNDLSTAAMIAKAIANSETATLACDPTSVSTLASNGGTITDTVQGYPVSATVNNNSIHLSVTVNNATYPLQAPVWTKCTGTQSASVGN